MSNFDFSELTVARVHAAYLDGTLTARELCEHYLERLKALEPRLNSVICVNPKALEEADKVDAFIAANHALNGTLFGIPVMLKDNFNTTDMPTAPYSLL